MKSLKKLALVSAIAVAPFTANALEALDDEFLGDVTGQEGITIDKEYLNTIEEFKYVDGDGDGSTGAAAGSVSIVDLSVGNTDKVNNMVLEEGQQIDAASNGVLITAARVSGKDTSIDGILIGNSANAQNSIGSLSIRNAGNEWNAGVSAQIAEFVTVSSATTSAGTALGEYDGLTFIQGTTLISSKTAGTGVVITGENYSHTESITYSDHDGAGVSSGNSVSIVGLTQFKETAGVIGGATSTTTIDVENGQLVIGQVSNGSTVIDGIVIGTGDIGSIGILGNSYQGTTRISGH